MAVESPHINLFSSSQLLINREMLKPNDYHQQLMDSTTFLPQSSTMLMPESYLPFHHHHHQPTFCDPNKADSGLTYHIPAVPSRKRSRDSSIAGAESQINSVPLQQKNKLSSSSHSPFLDQQLLYQFQNQQQSEIDRYILQHTEKVRMEIEEQRIRQSRMVLSAIQEAVVKKLKEKDQEIMRMGKMNWVLQERVKSLSVENQVWREMAQSNEAAANSLRTNLEQVLAHVNNDAAGRRRNKHDDDVESCCSSNNYGEAEEKLLVEAASVVGRMCNECGVRESVVLLLPCRHLCLCTLCASTLRNCPLCHSPINATVCVNFSQD